MTYETKRRHVKLTHNGEVVLEGFTLSDIVLDEIGDTLTLDEDGNLIAPSEPGGRPEPISIKIERLTDDKQRWLEERRPFEGRLLVKQPFGEERDGYDLEEIVLTFPETPARVRGLVVNIHAKSVRPAAK